MNFNFERQGPVTYLVCQLDNNEVVDTLTLGMLTNNHIVGLAPVLYTELNGQRFLKYNISAKISAGHFFAGDVARERALEAFTNIANSICAADDYMIDQSCFTLAPEYVFLNVSSCEVSLVCIPVLSNKDINAEIVELFSSLIETSGLKASGQVPQIDEYLANEAAFNIYSFKNIIEEEKKGISPIVSPIMTAVNSNPEEPKPLINNDSLHASAYAENRDSEPVDFAPLINNGAESKQIPDFNSTISINDAPAMFRDGDIPKPSVAPHVEKPVKPIIPSAPPVNSGLGMLGGSEKGNTGGFVNKPPVTTPPVVNPPVNEPVSASPMGGVQIPGKSSIKIPGSPANAPMGNNPPVNSPDAGGEKKKSFFGSLFAKKEKTAKEPKQKKQKKGGAPAMNMPGAPAENMPGGPVAPNTNNPVNVPPFGANNYGQPSPSFGAQQFNGPINSVPVQNQFNATTVLDNSIGETTVLSASTPKPGEPYLTRVKNQEQIIINKPVFRIGKEKSYVDFFISDNTAISRSHANIIIENGEYFVEDMNSTNHTFVNSAMITGNQKVQLKDSDIIRLANEEFIFHC